MDRARVIAPSVSFAAHVGGAAFLVIGLLVLPDGLPAPARGGLDGLVVTPALAVSLGGGALRGGRGTAPRVAPVVSRVAPVFATDLRPVPVDLDPGFGVEGVPDGTSDGPGGGLCLANCGGGPGAGPGEGAVLPALDSAPAAKHLRVGGDVREPRKVRHVAPSYPALAIATRVQGRVVLDCVIDEDGRVSSVTVLKSQPLLDVAAVEAVRQWRYQPTLLNGTRVSVLLTVTVDFRLR